MPRASPASAREAITTTRAPATSTTASCSSYAATTSSSERAGPVRWSVPAPQAIAPPTARASAAERRMSVAASGHSRPVPRCAVSMASATPRPCDHRWRRKANVASQSTVSGAPAPAASGSATTCAAAKTARAAGRARRSGPPPASPR